MKSFKNFNDFELRENGLCLLERLNPGLAGLRQLANKIRKYFRSKQLPDIPWKNYIVFFYSDRLPARHDSFQVISSDRRHS